MPPTAAVERKSQHCVDKHFIKRCPGGIELEMILQLASIDRWGVIDK